MGIKCPYCNEEMEPGYIQCRDSIFWNTKKRLIAALPPIGGTSINLASEESGVFSGFATRAYNCTKCKKIIVDYGEK